MAFETEIRPGTCCISYNIDDDEMLRRMLHRAETSGRSDDNESTMKERLKTFHKHAEPVVNYFKAKEKLIQVVALRVCLRLTAKDKFNEVLFCFWYKF